MKQIAYSYIVECLRNTAVFIGNLCPSFLFILCSWGLTIGLQKDSTDFLFIIKGQFFPISIMLLLFSFSFATLTVYLAELKANRTVNWLKRSGISSTQYFISIGVGVFFLMNGALVVLLLGYSSVVSMSFTMIWQLILICNATLLALYPLSFFVAGFVKNGKTAQVWLMPLTIVLMFSITMPSLFYTLANKDPQQMYVFLAWNPMLYLTDLLQYVTGLTSTTWLPIWQYVVILFTTCMLFSYLSKKYYMR